MRTNYLLFKNSRKNTFVHKNYSCKRSKKLANTASVNSITPYTHYVYRISKGKGNNHMKLAKNSLFMKERGKGFGKTLLQFVLIALLFVLISLTISFIQPDLAISDNTDLQLSKVTVGSGDTLWSIAKIYHNSEHDIREFIYYIKKLNQLETAQIHPGQELYIPSLD